MSANTKRVFYVKYLADPVFAEMLGRRDDVRLDRLENESTDDAAAPILAAAHVYQVGSARDEIAAQISRRRRTDRPHAGGAGRLDQRRRLRHRRRQGLHRCRHPGGEPGRRQSRGGRRACARHAARAVEAHPRNQPGDAARAPPIDRVAYMGNDVLRQDHRHHRARQCRQPHRAALPRPVRHAGARLRPLSHGRGVRGARRRKGRARRPAAPQRLRVDQLPADGGDPRHDRGGAVRLDAHRAPISSAPRAAISTTKRRSPTRCAAEAASPAPASTSGRPSRRPAIIRCCNSTTCW